MSALTFEIGTTWLMAASGAGMWLGRIIRQHMNAPLDALHPVRVRRGELGSRGRFPAPPANHIRLSRSDSIR